MGVDVKLHCTLYAILHKLIHAAFSNNVKDTCLCIVWALD